MALAPDKQNDWEALGALTSYAVEHQRRFYMFYTAVPKGYKGRRAEDTSWLLPTPTGPRAWLAPPTYPQGKGRQGWAGRRSFVNSCLPG